MPEFARARALPALVARAPWWLRIVVGLAAIVLGLLLITRPLSSLTVLAIYIGLSFIFSGIGDAIDASESESPGVGIAFGLVWVALGVAMLVWLGRSIDLLGPVIAIALIAGGVVRLVRAIRGTTDERVAAGISGTADLVLGYVALQWPDVTLIVIAVLFGARTVFSGVQTVWRGVAAGLAPRPPRDTAHPPTARRRRLARFGRGAGGALSLVLAVIAALIGSQLREASPLIDTFAMAPAEVPGEPGRLLKSEPFERGIPDDADAWRILYTTTDHTGAPVLATGIVVRSAGTSDDPQPVIAWAHGTTGYAENCAPTLVEPALAAGALPALDEVVAAGWTLVATDYAGLGTPGPQPYLIGEGEARSVLDSVRAARELETIALTPETVVWGHSQGGHAALWTGIVQPGYAPDVPLAGVAAMAPASDPVGLTGSLSDVRGGSVFGSFVVAAYTETYPDVRQRDYVIPAAQQLVREMSTRCLSEPGVFVSILSALSIEDDRPLFSRDPTTGAFGARLDENTPRGAIDAPVLVAQGGADSLITPSLQDGYVEARCAAGYEVDYRTYAGLDHLGVVAPESPLIGELLEWTTARLAGDEPESTC